MKILVTGGAGFIGSHIVDKLIEEGEGVIVIDNLSTGKKENLNPKAKFYEGDIRSQKKLEQVFKENYIKKVIHQAAQASVVKSVEDPAFDAEVNILGSINLLECCRKFDVEKIVYASSAAVYGNPQYLPIDEKHPISPMSPYGNSKYVAELYLSLYHRLYNLNYTILRYSNVYGPRQDPYGEAGVVAIFSNKLVKNKKPTIFGDGNQTRDFVYVTDIVAANLLALEKGNNQTFNLGTTKKTSINNLFKLLKEISQTPLSPIYGAKREGEIKHSTLTFSKAKKELNWESKTDIKDGLTSTINYFRNQ